ncbi:M48 family metallopeptidase [Rhodoferax sp. AJA081-3]|uniref:M48 family metallopeptidase n=1 Tax=Rhodoferax sp. AJA081-3 TaxID=2752316 RepID=UPI001ADF1AF8|nr:M48 family metallopeptidase [Rhodoferax sp. AJA081-3]QTN29720.1 M48 family metallopeptidase [Rhodoferax sp. AJA081-3]
MNELFSGNTASLNTTVAFALALTLSLVLKFWLASRQIRHVAQHRSAVPAAFAEKITLTAHQKAAEYTITKTRFGLLELSWGAAIAIAWTLLGGLSVLNQWLVSVMGHGIGQQVALLVAFMAIGSALDLPFTLYQTFVIEERFGFNKTSLKLWLQDFAKSLLLSALIGLPFITLVIWMMGATGPWWWLWVWGVWMGFNLLALLIYPTWIAPLFNKFQPLEDPQVKERVSQLMARCGFTSKGFFVMDGSKRSAHANAYFTGFGASKRVVFYDTLLAQLSPPEVDAVLAHELGHFKHKHVIKRIVSMFAISLLGFFALGWLSQQLWFYTGLGVLPNLGAPNDALALLLFMMVLPLLGTFMGPLFAQLSRKHEFEADAYAVAQTSGPALAGALLKLFEDNASTLTPDPVYVQFYYSHPPATERLGRILGTAH